MLTRTQKLVILFVTCLPVLAMFLMSAAHVARQFNYVLANARWLLSEQLTSQLGRQVSVGSARLVPLGTAVVENIQIAEGASLAAGRVLVARTVRVEYDFAATVLGGAGASGVKRVDVTDPRVRLVRRPDGTLNIMDLVKPKPGKPGPPFRGVVRASGGQLTFVDRKAFIGASPRPFRLHDLSLTYDAARYPVVAFSGGAAGDPGTLKSASFTGTYDLNAKLLRLDLSAAQASAPFFAGLSGLSRTVDVRAGTVDASFGVTTRIPPSGLPPVTGYLTISGAEVLPPGLRSPVRQIDGRVLLAGRTAAVDLTGTFGGTRAHVTGNVSNFEHPKLDLAVSAPRVDLVGLSRALGLPEPPPQVRISGLGGVKATVGGTQGAPSAATSATIGSVSAYGYTAGNIALSVGYERGTLLINSMRFTLGGARGQASGSIQTTGARAVSFRGSLRGLPLRTIRAPAGASLTGVADADLALSGTLAAPVIRVDAKIARGSVGGMPFTAASAQVTYDIRRRTGSGKLSANAAGGLVMARGSGGPRNVDVSYTAEAIDLSTIAALAKHPELSGTLYSTGRVTGDPSDPAASGVLEVFKGRYQDYQIDYTRVAFSGDRQGVTVSQGVARIFPAELAFSGRASGLDTARIDFHGDAHVRRLQVDKLLELTGKRAEISGTVEGDFTVSGAYLPRQKPVEGKLPLVDTVASGELSLKDGTAFGFLISSAGATISYANDVLTLSDTSISSQDARIDLTGTVNVATHELNLGFDAKDFDLVRVRDRLDKYVTIGGVANSSGTITGQWDDPTISTHAGIDKLTLDEARFDQATVDATYSGGMISSWHAVLSRDKQVFDLQGKDLDLLTACVADASGTITNVSVPDLWSMVVASPYLMSEQAKPIQDALRRIPRLTKGTLNGNFSLQGCFRDAEGQFTMPDGSLKLTADDVGVDIRRIDTISVDVVAKGGTVLVNQFRAVSEDTYVDLAPTEPGKPVYDNGNLDMMLTANNLDLSRLRPWLGENTPSGNATVDFTFKGPAGRPDIRGSVEVVNPGVRGIAFDKLRVSQIKLGKDRVDVTEIILAFGRHQVIGHGYVPWSWDQLTIPKDRPLEFTANLANENLKILSAFTPTVDDKRTTGALEAQVNVSGTIGALDLSGAIKATDGAIALKGFTNTFTNVDIDLGFDGKNMLVNALSMQSSAGGTIAVQPGGTVELTSPEQGYGNVNLQMVANGLTIEEKNMLGYQESVKTQLDVGLAITGTITDPIVSEPQYGTRGIVISNSDLSFAVPEGGEPAGAAVLPIRPFFMDVGIEIGENVRVRPPMMSLLVAGGGGLSGQLGNERATIPFNAWLNLQVKEGDMTLKETGTRFTIVAGGEMDLGFRPPDPPEFTLSNFQARTSVMATGPLGQRERYQISMTVNGPISNMNIALASDPPGLTREQMLAALGHVEGLFAGSESGLQADIANALTAVGTSALFMPIQRIFVEKLGFEEFTLEYSPISPLAIYLSKRLFGDFYLSFYQRLSASLANVQDSEWQLRFGYRFRTFYSVGVGVDDQQTLTATVNFVKAFY